MSGVVAAIGGGLFGESWVSGDPPSVRYSPARCADFLEYAPHARSCETAATLHHYSEVIDYRIAAGVVGLAILWACRRLARRGWQLFRSNRLPTAFDETIAVALFGVAAVYLIGYGIDQQRLGYQGAGFYLSAGVVALVAAAFAA